MTKPITEYRPNPNRAIFVHGDIDEQLIYKLTPEILRLKYMNSDPISIFIDSQGGLLSSLDAIQGLIKVQNQDYDEPCQTITIVTNSAASAAAYLLILGDYAIAYSHCEIHFHGIRIYFPKDYPMTFEISSWLASDLRKANVKYARELFSKIEQRFQFRFFMFFMDVLEGELPDTYTADYKGFKKFLYDNVSDFGIKILEKSESRQTRYQAMIKLLKLKRRSIKARTQRQAEALLLSSIIDYEMLQHADDDSWTLQEQGLNEINEDFYLLNEYMTLSDSTKQQIKTMRNSYAAFLSKNYTQKNMALFKKSTLEPFWAFYIALCHCLQEGENKMEAKDAYYLGLIDEVWGQEDLPSKRDIEEVE